FRSSRRIPSWSRTTRSSSSTRRTTRSRRWWSEVEHRVPGEQSETRAPVLPNANRASAFILGPGSWHALLALACPGFLHVNRTVTINWAILAGSAQYADSEEPRAAFRFVLQNPGRHPDRRDGCSHPRADGIFHFL